MKLLIEWLSWSAFSSTGRPSSPPEAPTAWSACGTCLTAPARLIGREITGPDGHVQTLTFSPDNRVLAGGNRGQIRLWNVTDPHEPHTLARLDRARQPPGAWTPAQRSHPRPPPTATSNYETPTSNA